MKRQIELTIETATRWYNGTDAELKALSVQTFPELEKKELPKTWNELGIISGWFLHHNSEIGNVSHVKTHRCNSNTFATKEQAKASVALAQLSQLREVYRNGWVPDWKDDNGKFCVIFYGDKAIIDSWKHTCQFLSFQDEKTGRLFLENFRDLIKQAKPLLS